MNVQTRDDVEDHVTITVTDADPLTLAQMAEDLKRELDWPFLQMVSRGVDIGGAKTKLQVISTDQGFLELEGRIGFVVQTLNPDDNKRRKLTGSEIDQLYRNELVPEGYIPILKRGQEIGYRHEEVKEILWGPIP